MRNYVIIGGSSGIGEAIVELLSAEGNKVFATYNSNAKENTTHTHYQKLDVLSDELNLDILPEEINGLVYCPGSINLKPFKRFTEEDFLDDFRLQVLGATKIIQNLLPKLKKGNGSIVLFSTIAVQQGFNFHSQVSTSKGAIEGLTRALSAELAHSIRINAIAPSLTQTPLASKLLSSEEKINAQAERNPLKKVGTAKDIAEAAMYLLSDKSSWVTGQILHVDGGFSSIK